MARTGTSASLFAPRRLRNGRSSIASTCMSVDTHTVAPATVRVRVCGEAARKKIRQVVAGRRPGPTAVTATEPWFASGTAAGSQVGAGKYLGDGCAVWSSPYGGLEDPS